MNAYTIFANDHDRNMYERSEIDRIAREWLATPFHDMAEVKGRQGGVDCAKLLKCVFVEAGLVAPFEIENYSPQHFLHSDTEKALGYVLQHAREIPMAQAQFGDVILYKIGRVYAHGAIIIKPGLPHIIHAWYRAKMVVEAMWNEGELGDPIRKPRFFTRWGAAFNG